MPRINSLQLQTALKTESDRLDALASRLDLDLSNTSFADDIDQAISDLSEALDDAEEALEELDAEDKARTEAEEEDDEDDEDLEEEEDEDETRS